MSKIQAKTLLRYAFILNMHIFLCGACQKRREGRIISAYLWRVICGTINCTEIFCSK